MEIVLIISLLIIPVVLLASPVILFASKGRADISLYYLISLTALQVAVLTVYWGKFKGADAAVWVMGLLGLSQVLGSIWAASKLQTHAWYKYAALCLVLSTSLVVIALQTAKV